MSRYRNVPPLPFLRGFEAAARLGNFSQAAAELGLTQSAVSHQMRLLEDRIGQPLFRRVGRSVYLTDAGRDYQRTVRRALEQLEDGYQRLEPYRKPASVVIYAPRDFAARWLMPRLPQLRTDLPECEPWLDTSGGAIDFEEVEVNIAILYLEQPPDKQRAMRLVEDSLSPVLSPGLAAARKLDAPSALLKLPRLHDERPIGWPDWLRSAGVAFDDVSAGLDFDDSDFVLTAAELGLGVALASLPMAAPAIAAKRLVQPFGHTLDPGKAWFAVSTEEELADPQIKAVWDWFAAEAGEPG